MSANYEDIKIHKAPMNHVPTVRWQAEANTTAMYAGEPVKLKAAGSPYVIPCADADLTIATDTVFVGICANDSTQTAAADGYVDVYVPLTGIIYSAKVSTGTNFNTDAKIAALCGDRVTVNLAGGIYTLDENAGDGAANAFYIVGGDKDTQTVYFTIRAAATYLSA